MNILSLILGFIPRSSQTSEKNSPIESHGCIVESPQNLEEKISQHQKKLEYSIQIKSQNSYQPRLLPDFSSDNLSYLSGHPAIKPR